MVHTHTHTRINNAAPKNLLSCLLLDSIVVFTFPMFFRFSFLYIIHLLIIWFSAADVCRIHRPRNTCIFRFWKTRFECVFRQPTQAFSSSFLFFILLSKRLIYDGRLVKRNQTLLRLLTRKNVSIRLVLFLVFLWKQREKERGENFKKGKYITYKKSQREMHVPSRQRAISTRRRKSTTCPFVLPNWKAYKTIHRLCVYDAITFHILHHRDAVWPFRQPWCVCVCLVFS